MRLNSTALASLRFFEAAARLLSFTRAATELSVTTSAVSHQIRYLEESLGCKLFYRLPKQIKLTEEGEKLASTAAHALRELDRTASEVVASRRSSMDIRLRAGPSFALCWLVPRLGVLRARHPDITLHVIAAEHDDIDPVHRNFDLAVDFGKVGRDDPPALHSEVLIEEYLSPVCSPRYAAEHELLRAPSDLARCTLLHDGVVWESASEDAEWRYWLAEVGAEEVDSNQGQFFTLTNLAIEAALVHQGVAMGRTALVEDLLSTGRLLAPFSHRVKSPCCYSLLYPRETADRAGVRAVIDWLREEAEKTSKNSLLGTTSERAPSQGCEEPALSKGGLAG